MIFWNKTPEARVGRVVAIITHHKVVVHFKGVAGGRLVVNVNHAILYSQIVTLVLFDYTLVKR